MRIRLSDIGKEGLHIVTFRGPEWLINIPELASETEDTRLSSNIRFNLRLVKVLREITVYGTIRFSIVSLCARCLRDVDIVLSPEVNLVLSPQHHDWERDDKDVDYETYSGDEFDLGSYLREVIAMSLPVKVLCQEECKGLCQVCGANLNEGSCSCKDDRIDPRFAVLRGLKI
jgi:uncharacterized protein